MKQEDQRDNLPSASEVPRLMKCAESHNLSLRAQEMRVEAGEFKKDEWREHGNSMHDAIYNQSSANLETDQDRMDYSKITRRLREFLGGWGARDEDSVIREERMWLHDGIVPIFSGRPDYVRISASGKRAAIIEFKSLWNKETDPAENDQLWSQAVLLADELEIEEFTLQIISPHYTYVPYLATRAEVETYGERLRTLLARVMTTTEPITGDWCKHCRGLLICPAIQREAALKTEQHPSELKLEDAPKLLETLNRLEKFIEEARAYYRLVLAKDPTAVPGWRLQEKRMRFLKSPEKLMETVVPIIGEKSFWKSVSVSITKLEAAWGEQEIKPEDVLAPFITVKVSDASLVRDKKNGENK